MSESGYERVWARAILYRSLVLGFVLGIVALVGATAVLSSTAREAIETAVVIAAILFAFGIGMWAGAPVAEAEIRLRGRWLKAAALVALAGSFSTLWRIYEPVYPGPWWPLLGLLLVLALPIYALGMVPPSLLEEAHHAGGDDFESAERLLGRVVLGMVGGATLGVLVAGFLVLPRWTPGPILVAAALVLILPITRGGPDESLPETILFETVTPYGALRVTEVVYPGERQPERRLYLNEEEESGELTRSGAPTLGYIAAAERWLSSSTPPGSSYLFLGGGAYTLPRRIAERDPHARIVVVELDPEVTRIAQHFFGLKRAHGITTVHGDARGYLQQADHPTFDRIYLDVYGGGETLPHALVTREAAETMSRRLNPDGIVAVNVIGNVADQEQRRLWSIGRTFASVFPNTALYLQFGRDFPKRQNLLLVGTFNVERQHPAAVAGFALWPREEWPNLEAAVIFRDVAAPSTTVEAPSRPSAPRSRERRA